MQHFSNEPTSMAEWRAIVHEAQSQSGYQFDDNIECYLVITLDKFTTSQELASSAIAIDYLSGIELSGQNKGVVLRQVGDECLLLSGLFPERALKKNVSLGYFIGLGQQAYNLIAATKALKDFDNELFSKLSDNFIGLMDVLHTMRKMPAWYQDIYQFRQ